MTTQTALAVLAIIYSLICLLWLFHALREYTDALRKLEMAYRSTAQHEQATNQRVTSARRILCFPVAPLLLPFVIFGIVYFERRSRP